MGGVLHTLNLRLHPDELAYIVNHADDRAILVDESAAAAVGTGRGRSVKVPVTIVVGATQAGAPTAALEYEALHRPVRAGARICRIPTSAPPPRCATRPARPATPKGVLYSHRALVLHTLGLSLDAAWASREHDIVLPVVPMFHANAWGMPFAAVMVGAKLVMPGPHLDPASLRRSVSDASASRSPAACRRSGWACCNTSTRTPASSTSRRSARCTSAAPPSRRR